MAATFSRRSLLLGAGGLAVGTVAGGVAGAALTADEADPTTSTQGAAEPFYGAHQAGIATPVQATAELVALDLTNGTDVAALRSVLQAWTAAAAAMASGQGEPDDASRDILQSGPARLTVTVGFGPDLFAKLGLDAQLPPGLAPVPAFRHDALEPRFVGGDVLVQVASDDALVASHAARRLVTLAGSTLTTRWWQHGFSRTPASTTDSTTPRNLMGQVDGSANPAPGSDLFDRTVWAGSAAPEWLRGGSFVVVRRIRMFLDTWEQLDRGQQERVIGRTKDTGAPLTGGAEKDQPDFSAQNPDGSLVIPATAHVRLSHPSSTRGARIFRRGFSYDDGALDDGSRDAGLLFLAWQADPRKGFLPIQARIDMGDRLNLFTRAVGSAIFACPPGVSEGSYLGASLLEA
jgi:dye decolorizing peroxidase